MQPHELGPDAYVALILLLYWPKLRRRYKVQKQRANQATDWNRLRRDW
jgi:hypothetical protein